MPEAEFMVTLTEQRAGPRLFVLLWMPFLQERNLSEAAAEEEALKKALLLWGGL